ncbi:venom metalloproteinase BumaMPs1-like isoform X2 [Ornithodoros turicata]|uniref:venom metalloproteinase BumaMPs1-like isoform X2 n=1 Tax=Ornithodoros turicata TaxID=34597 RepID=UPI003138BCC0
MAVWKALSFVLCISVSQAKRSVVYPRILESRDSNGHKVVSINDDISLRLSRTTVFARPLTFMSYEGGQLNKKVINVDHIEDNLYRDPEQQAAIIIRETSTGTELQGMLKNKFRIKSLPLEPRVSGQVAHVLEEMAVDENLDVLDLTDATDHIGDDGEPVPDTVYAEILALSDPSHMVDMTDSELTEYLAVYYTAMNMFFMLLTEPKVELRLVGILNLREQPPYMVTAKNERGKWVLVMGTTNYHFTRYLNKELDRERLYDGVVWMSSLGLGKIVNGTAVTTLAGVAFGRLCGDSRLVMVPDYEWYHRTLYVTAHEIGHMVGAQHDSAGELPICKGVHGYIMSDDDGKGPERVQFSECSQVYIRQFLSEGIGPKCWKTNFDYSDVINQGEESRGQQEFLNTYCNGRRAHLEIDTDSRCILTCCNQRNKKKPKCSPEITPNGTICGDNKVCFNEVCVDKEEAERSYL